jgi:hypothetical protein
MIHSASWATIIPETLYINKSVITLGSFNPVFCAFNSTPTFELKNPNYSVSIDDTLLITVINNDTIEHTFTIDGLITQNNYINEGNTETFIVKFTQIGSFAYYSKVPYGKQLGASGIIQVGYSEHKNYFWNLFDQEESLSLQLANGTVTNPNSNYRPQIFTINNLTYPATTLDMDGAIEEMVGDTIIIIDELMTLQLVPDKSGMYPVHDHNLVTVTTNAYPGGMMTKIHIME